MYIQTRDFYLFFRIARANLLGYFATILKVMGLSTHLDETAKAVAVKAVTPGGDY